MKIGRDNYTFEDLRRDMLLIEDEDKRNKDVQTNESRTITSQGDGNDLGRTWSRPDLADDIHTYNQIRLAEQIMKELENEEKCEK